MQFNKNGLVYALDRATGELLSADKFEAKTNWTSGVDFNPASATYGRPVVVPKYSTDANGQDVNTRGICPSSIGAKGAAPASFVPDGKIFIVPSAHK